MSTMSGGSSVNLPIISDASTSCRGSYQRLPVTGPWTLYLTRRSHDPTASPLLRFQEGPGHWYSLCFDYGNVSYYAEMLTLNLSTGHVKLVLVMVYSVAA